MLKRVPLIHDESSRQSRRPSRPGPTGLRRPVRGTPRSVTAFDFSSADHALDATVEGAGVLLAPDVLAYDHLRTGRLVMPFDLTLPSGRCYAFVCPKKQRELRMFGPSGRGSGKRRPPLTGVSARRAQGIRAQRRDRPRRANSGRSQQREIENGILGLRTGQGALRPKAMKFANRFRRA